MKTALWHATVVATESARLAIPSTGDRRARGRTCRRPLTCVVLWAGLALACSERPVPGPDTAAGTDRLQEDTLPGIRVDLARIVGRESAERGDTLLRLLQQRGLEPRVQEFPNTATDREPRGVGRNLIVTVGEGRRDIVVGAHYDVVRLREGGVTGGAVDNGAAAIVLTRVAETLERHDLDHRIRVVLFDLEEVGLLGSRAYVRDADPDRIAAMVNVDVVAGDDVLMYGPTTHDGNEVVYRSLRVTCADAPITCMSFPRYPASDDRPFQATGIPNVSLGMNEAIASHQMWLLLNAGAQSALRRDFVPNLLQIIHTSEDTIERVSRTAMIRVHNAVVALVLELDRAFQGATVSTGGDPRLP